MHESARLGVNIDHIATVRQARRTFEPDPVTAATLALLGGADSIVLHVRRDRRHVQERDLRLLKEVVPTHLNLEMGLSEEIIRIALEVKPYQVTLVPEKREEVTTEGGLDVVAEEARIGAAVERFHAEGIKVSLFIDPRQEQLESAKRVGAGIVELHTGQYANATDPGQQRPLYRSLCEAARLAANLHLFVAAGHGLTYFNVRPVALIPDVEELNIGHSIVSRALMVGMTQAVRELKRLMERRS